MLTPEQRADLRHAYTPPDVPPCCLCGGTLSIQSMGGGRLTKWACTDRPKFQPDDPGNNAWYDHYRVSEWREPASDYRIIQLLDQVDALESQVAEAISERDKAANWATDLAMGIGEFIRASYLPCPNGCGCRFPDDADGRECACDGPCCTDDWPILSPLGTLARSTEWPEDSPGAAPAAPPAAAREARGGAWRT